MDSGRTNSLEDKLGLFWLQRLGIVVMVFGFVFLMMYSVQLLGPMQSLAPYLKIGAGALVSILLLAAGYIFDRRSEKSWFGQGLAAGGWSLAYFTTYAAYYIPEAHIVPSPVIETVLLTAVAIGSFLSAVKAGSELMSILSIALAGTSILFAEPGLLGDTSFIILAVVASILGNKYGWKRLFAFGLAVSYAGHYYCSKSLLGTHTYGNDDAIAAAFISTIWLAFSVGIGYSIKTSEDQKTGKGSFITVLSYLNAAFFATGLFIFGWKLPVEALETILAAAGAVYIGAANWLRKKESSLLSTVYFLLGLAFLNGAKAMRFNGVELITLDIMQIWLLAILGIRFNIFSFRLFAYFLTLTFIPAWSSACGGFKDIAALGFWHPVYDRVALTAALAFAHIAYYCIKHAPEFPARSEFKAAFLEKVYGVLAIVMLAVIAQDAQNVNVVALTWTAVTFLYLWLGFRFRDSIYLGLCLASALVALIATAAHVHVWTAAISVAQLGIIYGAYAYLRVKEKRQEGLNNISVSAVFPQTLALYAGFIYLTCLLGERMPSTYLSLAFGVQALVFMISSFVMREPEMRRQAFMVVALLVGKLLFFDLANKGTLERIVSFIGAGMTLILSSYVYALGVNAFKQKVKPDDFAAQPQSADQEDLSERAEESPLYPETA
jgi:Predicted membrane protein (DUF2339).